MGYNLFCRGGETNPLVRGWCVESDVLSSFQERRRSETLLNSDSIPHVECSSPIDGIQKGWKSDARSGFMQDPTHTGNNVSASDRAKFVRSTYHRTIQIHQLIQIPSNLVPTHTSTLTSIDYNHFSTMMRSILITLLVASATTAFVPVAPISRSSSALNVAIDTSDIKNGVTVEIEGEPYKVLSFSIMKQARGAAKTTIKFKNLQRGTTIENTYRSGEKFETAMIEKRSAQFTYKDEVS
jgi:hypothetical protein